MYPDSYLNYEDDQTVAFFSLPYEALNNWSAHRVQIYDHSFQTAEAAFQYAKFRITAPDVAEAIIQASSPWQVFQIINANRDKTPADWKTTKQAVMTDIIQAKVAQNKDVHERLIQTGNRRIIENSPWDSYWGVGPDRTGQNVLGQIYMQIRSKLNPDTE